MKKKKRGGGAVIKEGRMILQKLYDFVLLGNDKFNISKLLFMVQKRFCTDVFV